MSLATNLHVTLRNFRSLLRHYLMQVVAIVLWLLIVIYWRLDWLSFSESTIYYGLIVFRQTGVMLFLAAVVSFIAASLLFLVIRHPTNQRQDAIYAVTLILLFVAVPCSCVAGVGVGECGTTFTHEARVSYHEYLYQLAFIANSCFDEASYNLYRCDAIGFVCDRVFVLDIAPRTPMEPLGNYQAASTATLAIDSIGNGISIRVNGNIIHTYYP